MPEYLAEKLLLTTTLKSFSMWPSAEVLTPSCNYFLYLKGFSDHHSLLSLPPLKAVLSGREKTSLFEGAQILYKIAGS